MPCGVAELGDGVDALGLLGGLGAIVLACGHAAEVVAQGGLQIIFPVLASTFQLHQVPQVAGGLEAVGAGGREGERVPAPLGHIASRGMVAQIVPLACLQAGGGAAQ
ncbi:MAG TPA: hypothetical protein DDW22_07525 [Prevotellaceae bacterium]|nr:hypothetical protein [Prevotellaceae bacterium]